MTKEQIDQAFEGRWRIKAENKPVASVKGVKDLCHDFFTAGIMIAEQTTVPEVSPSPIIEVVCHDFDYWWKLYGKAVGRKDCEKKWAKMTVKEREDCIAATPAYVASTPDKQYRKNPLTYLNQKAWNDEIIPRNNGNSKPTPEQQQNKLADILVG